MRASSPRCVARVDDQGHVAQALGADGMAGVLLVGASLDGALITGTLRRLSGSRACLQC